MSHQLRPATGWIPSAFINPLVFASLFIVGFVLASQPATAKPVYASIVVDAANGKVLQATNADTLTYPASLTKMMTLYLLFEALDKKKIKRADTLTFSLKAARQPATNLNADPGDAIGVETAILALVVRSANDAAMAIAERLGGSEAGFAKMMNAKAKALGMTRTSFRNPNGLPNAAQRTTARDMAILGVALMRDYPQYYDYFSRASFSYHGITYVGHNRLLKSYSGTDGIKTGYIRLSGYNLVSSAERKGRRLVAVVLGGQSAAGRDRQMASLLDQGFKLKKGNGQVLVAKLDKSAKPVKAETAVAKAEITPAPKSEAEAVKPAETPTVQAEDDALEATLASSDEDVADTDDGTPTATAAADLPLPAPKPESAPVPTEAAAVSATPALATEAPSWKKGKANYGIQVGAYAQYKPALNAANKASTAAPKLLADARIVIEQAEKKNGKIYRARLLGLSRDQADKACKALAAQAGDCMIFKADSALAMGGN